MGNLTVSDCDDLLIEIFLWLPARALIKFKLVCKGWHSLISSHEFSNQHTLHHIGDRARSKPPPHLLLRLKEPSDYFYLRSSSHVEKLVPYNFSPSLPGPVSVQSCSNGLFLIQCNNVENPLEVCHVYNPTTQRSRKILLKTNSEYSCVLGLNLAFDPLESPHYKIICVRATRRRSSNLWRSWLRRCQIEVYESDMDSWKLYGKPFLAPHSSDFGSGVYWKGGIHWRGIFLDLQNCAVRAHPEVPGDIGAENFYEHHMESNGCLHSIRYFKERKSVMIFEMQSDNSEWLLKYHVNLEGTSGPESMLSVIKAENEEDSVLVFIEPGKVMAYYLHANCAKELVDFRMEAFYEQGCVQFSSDRTVQFIETLAPI